MDELAAYGVARTEAKDMASDAGQAMFGFEDVGDEYEITTVNDAMCLDDYNVDIAIYAADTQNFNLVVREDNPKALHSLPKDKLRKVLTRILDSV
jgi:hypothetical protein